MQDAAFSAMDDPRVPEIVEIIARETDTPREQLVPEASIEALGIPSLDMVQAIFAIETHFDVEIPVVADRAGTAEFVTVGDLLTHILATIDALGKGPHPGPLPEGAGATPPSPPGRGSG